MIHYQAAEVRGLSGGTGRYRDTCIGFSMSPSRAVQASYSYDIRVVQ